jgi:NADPH-dependent 7-cyano-7-deazaguanine reductase QueF-like protein
MASAVYKLVYHGSKIWRSVALNVLNHTAKPIIAMIRAWMLEVT